MSHYANDDRFDHIFFYDSDDFLSSNKKILASQLEQFAEMFEKGKKREFGYSKFRLIYGCTTDDYEMDILKHECLEFNKGVMTNEEKEFFKELLFVKNAQPYIDAGYLVYDGKKTKPPIHAYAPATTDDYWFPTEKCKIDYEKYVEEKKQKKYNEALRKAAIEAGVLSTDGTGKPAEFCNPDCYTNIPIFTTDQIKIGLGLLVVSGILLITIFAPFIVLIWVWYLCDVYKDYKQRQFAAERYYRATHGLPYNKK